MRVLLGRWGFGGRRRAARLPLVAAAVGLVAGCTGEIPTTPGQQLAVTGPRGAAAPGVLVDVFAHAHPDDWPLFMGDRVRAAVQAGRAVVLVYATAGDGGNADPAFWEAREAASRAAVDAITPAGAWSCAAETVNAHALRRCEKGAVVSYYLRLPDGNGYSGEGFGRGSLRLLQNGTAPLAALDASTSYASWADLTATVGGLVAHEAGTRDASQLFVHAPEHDRAISPNDHPDHYATADLLRAASTTRSWTVSWYVDFETIWSPVNLGAAAIATKRSAFLAYDGVLAGAGYGSNAGNWMYNGWLERTYFRTQVSVPPSRAAQTTAVVVTGMPTTAQLNGATFTVGATGGNGSGAYSFAASGACTAVAASGAVTMTAASGTCSVTAVRLGDAAYLDSPASAPAPGAAAAAPPATGPAPAQADVFVHAHPDDWQLFMGDRVHASAQAGRAVVLVYTSAGDAGRAEGYWRARETAAAASVNAVSSAGTSQCAARSVNGHAIWRCEKGMVVSYFLRLPDGGSGGGFGRGSLQQLQTGGGALSALDGSTSYASWGDLTATLAAIVTLENGDRGAGNLIVHAPEASRSINPNDHSDHYATADAVQAAVAGRGWPLTTYVDFETQWSPVNLSAAAIAVKRNVFAAYDQVVAAAGFETFVGNATYDAWLQRTYARTTGGTTPPPARAAQPTPVTVTGMPTAPQPNGSTFTVGATGGNGSGAYRFAASGACAAVPSTGAVTMTSASGTCSVTAIRLGDATYLDSPASSPATVAAAPSQQTAAADVFVHAHPDDWQLFMGDRVHAAAQAGRAVVLVYTSAGDAGNGEGYWLARENGAQASADAIGPAGGWTCAAQTINAHQLRRCAKGAVVSYYLRLPDGGHGDGTGLGRGSLARLRDAGAAVSAVDGSTTYTSWADFTTTVRALVQHEAGTRTGAALTVHAPEPTRSINPNDHPDHYATADAVQQATAGRGWGLAWYVDYETQWSPANLAPAAVDVKRTAFLAYDRVVAGAGFETYAGNATYDAWLRRTYFRTQAP